MAVNLKLAFDGSGGKTVSFNFPFADAGATADQVKTLMQTIVTNGDIYAVAPLSPSKADFVLSDVRPIDIS